MQLWEVGSYYSGLKGKASCTEAAPKAVNWRRADYLVFYAASIVVSTTALPRS